MNCRYKHKLFQHCLFSCRYLVSELMQATVSLLLTFTLIHFVFFIVFLQVVKTGGTPKVPDCFQRTPKKLCIPEKAEILAVNVDSKGGSLFLFVSNIYVVFVVFVDSYLTYLFYLKGVHAVLKTGNWVRYCIFDLATGKAEQENNFPTSNLAFLGQSERNVAIFTAGQVKSSPKWGTCFCRLYTLWRALPLYKSYC